MASPHTISVEELPRYEEKGGCAFSGTYCLKHAQHQNVCLGIAGHATTIKREDFDHERCPICYKPGAPRGPNAAIRCDEHASYVFHSDPRCTRLACFCTAPKEPHLHVDATGGRKDDAGKPRFGLLPTKALRVVVAVLEFGAKRYGVDNWKKVHTGRERYKEALLRHVYAWMDGEKNDPDSGLPHLAHAACCVLFLIELDGGVEVLARAPGVAE